jgi:4,5-dihydroxyphthalate decarboxylase
MSHGGATAFAPPPGVQLSYIPAGTSIGQMLQAGELDEAIVYIAERNLVDRSRAAAGPGFSIRPLFADQQAEGIRYSEKTGILPVNHVVVVRAGLLEKHPWIALNLYSAFLEAKRLSDEPVFTALQPWEADRPAVGPDLRRA